MPTSNGLSDIRVSSKWLFRLLQLTWIVFKRRFSPPRNQWTYIVSAAGPLANSWSLRWQRGDPFFCLVISSSRLDGPHPVFDGWKITRRVSMCSWGCPQMVSWVSCYTWMFFSFSVDFSQHTKNSGLQSPAYPASRTTKFGSPFLRPAAVEGCWFESYRNMVFWSPSGNFTAILVYQMCLFLIHMSRRHISDGVKPPAILNKWRENHKSGDWTNIKIHKTWSTLESTLR